MNEEGPLGNIRGGNSNGSDFGPGFAGDGSSTTGGSGLGAEGSTGSRGVAGTGGIQNEVLDLSKLVNPAQAKEKGGEKFSDIKSEGGANGTNLGGDLRKGEGSLGYSISNDGRIEGRGIVRPDDFDQVLSAFYPRAHSVRNPAAVQEAARLAEKPSKLPNEPRFDKDFSAPSPWLSPFIAVIRLALPKKIALAVLLILLTLIATGGKEPISKRFSWLFLLFAKKSKDKKNAPAKPKSYFRMALLGVLLALGVIGTFRYEQRKIDSIPGWSDNETLALSLSRETQLPVFIDFRADWCAPCGEIERTLLADPEVIAAMSGYIKLKVDVTVPSDENSALLKRYSITGLPALVFLDKDGKTQHILRGVPTKDALLNALKIYSAASALR